ncbi:Clp protease N-terminal domain-containing protein [Streptomyces griseus]|uniref:Clp protease N-terminal domain-containing protein n=2 Tax=Streptomycetaceae TaxID=2062 RepID=A0ABU2VZI7_9ACTN|nr:Clp protease N-terminal domain-containing protein [Streptomyces griseus]ARF71383.1 peptidase [Kitasatospora albolonga]MDT0491032.1 Clp protease N-terminal domain-containing protein [Streptomyces griseus]
MQNRTPRNPEQPAPNPVGPDAGFTVELASVVTGARRRALRDGDRQIDTAHLLHSLLESDPEVREAFDGGPQLARVLGYLVQRSIGYGLRWQGSVEDSGALPVVRDPAADGWSPSAVAAMEDALYRAGLRGEPRACGLDLLAALAADGECRAVEVLGRAGVDARWLSGRAVERTAGAPERA